MLVELNIKLKARERSDGRFEIRPWIGGKRISIYGTSAEELAKKYKALLKNTSRLAQPTSMGTKLFAWLDEWWEVYKKPNLKESSYLNISRAIKKHIKPNLQDKPLSRYSTTELTIALNEIKSTRMRKYSRGIIQEAFERVVIDGKIKTSPAKNLQPVKHVSKHGKAIALIELRDMVEQSSSTLPKIAWLYLLFCLFAGARRDEALFITFADCDFKNRILHIHGTKSVGSDRRLPMFPILEKIINAAKELGTGEGRIFNISKAKADDFFHVFRGDYPDAVQHWLRHTFGTVQICALNIPANTVSLWMGHSDASTTVNIYTHPEDLAPDIYYSGRYSEEEKTEILKKRYNEIISTVEKLL